MKRWARELLILGGWFGVVVIGLELIGWLDGASSVPKSARPWTLSLRDWWDWEWLLGRITGAVALQVGSYVARWLWRRAHPVLGDLLKKWGLGKWRPPRRGKRRKRKRR